MLLYFLFLKFCNRFSYIVIVILLTRPHSVACEYSRLSLLLAAWCEERRLHSQATYIALIPLSLLLFTCSYLALVISICFTVK